MFQTTNQIIYLYIFGFRFFRALSNSKSPLMVIPGYPSDPSGRESLSGIWSQGAALSVDGAWDFFRSGGRSIWGWVKTLVPSEPQNSWKMDVHPTKNGINRYCSIPIFSLRSFKAWDFFLFKPF